jgi:hypothetical protein
MSAPSDCTLHPHAGKLNPSSFIILCVGAVFSDKVLHGKWLPAEQLHVYVHMKCNVGDDIKFRSASMMRAMNKAPSNKLAAKQIRNSRWTAQRQCFPTLLPNSEAQALFLGDLDCWRGPINTF